MDKMALDGRLKWLCREILGREIDLKVFEEKLTIQKATYITRQLGMDWDYVFGWYVRGVYSSRLTVDLYNLKDLNPGYAATQEEKDIMNKLEPLKTLFCDLDQFRNMEDAYELVSTIIYAKRSRHMTEGPEIIEFAGNVKPWYTDLHIRKAMEYAEGLDLPAH